MVETLCNALKIANMGRLKLTLADLGLHAGMAFQKRVCVNKDVQMSAPPLFPRSSKRYTSHYHNWEREMNDGRSKFSFGAPDSADAPRTT